MLIESHLFIFFPMCLYLIFSCLPLSATIWYPLMFLVYLISLEHMAISAQLPRSIVIEQRGISHKHWKSLPKAPHEASLNKKEDRWFCSVTSESLWNLSEILTADLLHNPHIISLCGGVKRILSLSWNSKGAALSHDIHYAITIRISRIGFLGCEYCTSFMKHFNTFNWHLCLAYKED